MSRKSKIDHSTIKRIHQNLDRVKIIVIGVSHYEFLDPLPGVIQDLKLIEKAFVDEYKQGLYSRENYIELLNPTADKVRNVITQYAHERSAPGDVLIFYFSGHGCVVNAGDFGLCMMDAKINSRNRFLALSVLVFRDIVQTLSVADVSPIFIIDACFSGLAAANFSSDTDALIQNPLNSYLRESYGLLCSSNLEQESFADLGGSPFTKAFSLSISNSLKNQKSSNSPFVTLNEIATTVIDKLEMDGMPRPRCVLGPNLPQIPIARRENFQLTRIRFSPYMKRIIEFLWNNGQPIETTIPQLDEAIGKGSYANHRKLSLPPWQLLEDGEQKRTRRLSTRGIEFAQGKLSIPEVIVKDYSGREWVAASDAENILINHVSQIQNTRKRPQRKRDKDEQKHQNAAQLRLFKRQSDPSKISAK